MSRHLSTDDSALAALREQGWVPVLRAADVDDAVATARACREAGCDVVELTHSTPHVLDAVRILVAEGMTVGVGTVRSAAQVHAAAAAGAAFVVSFHNPDGFVQAAAESGVSALPGALTPHEVAAALDAGAPAVKIFPARMVPPAYLADLRAVVGHVPFVVTGGIPAEHEAIRTWLEAGAWCVGIGSPLGTVASVGTSEVTARARRLDQRRI